MPSQNEIINFGIEVDSQKALKEFARIQTAMNTRMKLIDKQTQKFGKTTGKIWKGLGANVRETYTESIKDSIRIQSKAQMQMRRIAADRSKIQKDYTASTDKQKALRLDLAQAEASKDKEAAKRLRDQLDLQSKLVAKQMSNWDELKGEANDYQRVIDDTAKHIAEVKERIETDLVGDYNIEALAEGLKEGGQKLQAPLRAFMSGDFPDAAESAAKVIGSGLIRGMQMGAHFLRQPKKGGAGGKEPKFGMFADKLDKAAATLAKLQPMFAIIGDSLKEFVKTWLEIDARVKDFNKGLLTSVSTTELLHAHGMDATAAFEDLHKSVQDIYDSANSLENIKWGIKPEDHIAVVNALNAEGYSMQRMKEDAEAAGKGVGEFTADLVHSSLAYSRSFGVSVQEITQLQGEMISEMGVRSEDAAIKLQGISDAAAESGLGATKFFNIIRGMSADMTLFNNRMEDAAKILKGIGKVMSPREAQRYMQTLTGFFKGQDLQSRIKLTLLAGGPGAVKDVLAKDTNRKIGAMAADFGLSLDQTKELRTAISDSPEATVKYMAKNRKLQSTQRSAAVDAAILQSKLNKGDLVDIASAVKDASPEASREIMESIAQKMFGQPIDKLSDVNRLAFQNITGFTDEMQDQQRKANLGMMAMQMDLVEALKHGEKLSDDQLGLLKNLGIQGDAAAQAAQLEKKSTDDIWKGLTGLQQKQLKGTDESKDYDKEALEHNKEIAEHTKATMETAAAIAGDTTSIKDKLDALKNTLESKLVKYLGTTGAAVVETAGTTAAGAGAALATVKVLPKLLPKVIPKLGGLVGGAGEAAGAAGAAGGAGLAGAAAAGGAVLAAGGALYEAYDQYKELAKETEASGGVWEGLKEAWKGPAKPLTPEEYAKKFPAPGAVPAGGAPPAPGTAPAGGTVDEIKRQIDLVKQQAKDISDLVQATRDIRPTMDGLKDTFGSHALVAEEQGELTHTTLEDGFADLADILKRKVKLDKSFLRDEFGKQVESSVLDAARQALVEYALIKDVSPQDLAKAVQDPSFDPKTYMQSNLEAIQKQAPGNAAGGAIIGRNPDGTAKVMRPPAGEMPVSIGRGETITPRGGGGGGGTSVTVNVSGIGGNDLAQMVKVAATNAILEYKRREGLH